LVEEEEEEALVVDESESRRVERFELEVVDEGEETTPNTDPTDSITVFTVLPSLECTGFLCNTTSSSLIESLPFKHISHEGVKNSRTPP
jgi:hypothetical protein